MVWKIGNEYIKKTNRLHEVHKSYCGVVRVGHQRSASDRENEGMSTTQHDHKSSYYILYNCTKIYPTFLVEPYERAGKQIVHALAPWG